MASVPQDGLVYLTVNVEGVELSSLATYTEIEDNDRLIDRAAIVLDDPEGALADIPREGQTVQIELGWASEHAVLFEGDIIRVVTEAYSGGMRRLTLVALDPSYRMMQGPPKTRDHTGSLSSIIQNIVGEYGLPIGQIQLDPDPQFSADLPLRQTNKKDWAFIQDIAERYRARAFVEYNDGASKFYAVSETRLVQGDAIGPLTYGEGPGQLLEFRYQRLAGSAAPQRAAITLDPLTGNVVTASPPPPVPPETPPATDPIKRQTLDKLGGKLADDYDKAIQQAANASRTPDQQRPQAVLAGLPSDPTLPDRAALIDPSRALGLHGEGLAVGTVQLRAKGKIGIQQIATWAEGEWYVRQVNHIVTDKQYWSRFVVTR